MHPEAMAWVADHATTDPVAVLDLGGRDANGSPRHLFPNADPYLVLDLADGPNVDVVADAAAWTPDREFDVVVCTELFEHTPVWPDICVTAFKALRSGGRLVATMAGPGRPPHGAWGAAWLARDEWYGNVDPDRLREVLESTGYIDVVVDRRFSPADVRAVATKP